ncbi:hypothetical protein B0T11DRAFT_333325 [Plectosphaerella cucumerina]|uniref:Phosphatidate cytidylyltransferase n=1 Tax=Plectosphaerella cucumerina TaxID=40658 RepID=A0A8K0T446_9PEZI|nr:hypothetical protein B0T11DRAFT_333325 [Plectosphaerella cucumerina]
MGKTACPPRPTSPAAVAHITIPRDRNAAGLTSAAPPTPATTITLDPIAHAASFLLPQHHNTRFFDFLFASDPDDRGLRCSRKDRHLHSRFWPLAFFSFRPFLAGAAPSPVLPPFPYDSMSTRSKNNMGATPATPRVISPSPTPSELQDASSQDGGYFTRSAARKRRPTPQPVSEQHIEEEDEEDSDPIELRRARTRSRSPIGARRIKPMTSAKGPKSPVLSSKPIANSATTSSSSASTTTTATTTATTSSVKTPQTNGHLTVPSAAPAGWSWRDFSRSPSPLGLIPIHRKWRTFVHRHEVPRKVLHVSIGFFAFWLYITERQTRDVAPWLLAALVPITTADWLRHWHAGFNRFYVSVLGALMRESEYAGWNGVIFYLLGGWIVLQFLPKDVGVAAVLLLSWCDTAASTFGRLWGRYTPRIRKGKSLAGSLAAFMVGIASCYIWWGWVIPTYGPKAGDEGMMFQGSLRLPETLRELTGLSKEQATISGAVALGVMSIWSGFIAAASEVVDIFGWDDNLTIPVLSGAGIWGFLKVFT